MMRKIDLIVIHCSATRADRSLTPDDLEMQHRRRGFNGTGYHYYIRKDGTVHLTRPIERIGAHVKGFNLLRRRFGCPRLSGRHADTGTTGGTQTAGTSIA